MPQKNNNKKSLLRKRIAVAGFLMILQAMVLLFIIMRLSDYYVYTSGVFWAISLTAVIYIVNKKVNPSYKLAWVIPILIFPVFGGLLYVLYGLQTTTKRFRDQLNQINCQTQRFLQQNEGVLHLLEQDNPHAAIQAKYLLYNAGYPVYQNTTVTYLTPGEKKFEKLKEELCKAQHYIFLEYFIIEEGIMWNSILDILVDKVRHGVDVRLIYDDMGCLATLPPDYCKKIEELGIRCIDFNPLVPRLSTVQNNRDHRKIVVIDGHTAFTGGINLADEYINAYDKYGHWKDASILLQGEAVWSFTMMFLQMWSLEFPDELSGNMLQPYRPHVYHPENFCSDGYVQPYSDSPMDDESVGENVYINLINKAQKYIYINTPYLIVDNEMATALTLAAKSGIDVRIVTPHHPDKWYVHMVTRAYYKDFIQSGIKIYEYTPGFIHSKTVAVDDEYATVGTINFDYRSLFLHFECGVLIFRNGAVQEIKEDFLQTLKVCHQVTSAECRERKWYKRFLGSILKLFAPLM